MPFARLFLGREVTLDELLSQTRGTARAVSSVPGSRLLSRFPYSYIRHVPGLDVALGVTAYEIADTVKTAVSFATKGDRAATDVARRLSSAVSGIVSGLTDLERHGIEVAQHSARGAMHAAHEAGLGAEQVARGAMLGVAEENSS
ncbi:MAG: hypothetical protein O3A47_03215 [Chloroflexi bacterium]|nr:hypothetical protein [Chloroflexota bacterium]